MNRLTLLLLLGSVFMFQSCVQSNPPTVTQGDMQMIYEQVRTPYKYGLVMVPEDTSKAFDCPTIFREDSTWYMSYIVFDGRGYETWLAESENLLEWKTLGKLLSFTDENRWDWNQSAGYLSLVDVEWGGSYQLQQYQNRYWMSYFGGNTDGYEQGMLSIGMAYTERDPTVPYEWDRLEEPVLMPTDEDAGFWENTKLYKSFVIWDKRESAGFPFVMYYNANGDSVVPKGWTERIGIAMSDDMVHWNRYQDNPVLDHKIGITGDAYIQKIDDIWVMFYYGAFWPEGRNDAFDRFACSYDLLHWTDWNGEDLIKPSEPFDNRFAHKPCVIKWNGIVYHYYTAVDMQDRRGLALATSQEIGKSNIEFVDTTQGTNSR